VQRSAGPISPIVETRAVSKSFGDVRAVDRVSLAVAPGVVHAIIGENGAGKTTLMRLLYGMYEPDEGTILVDGVPHTIRHPRDAIQLGIGMVHQHFMLVPSLTVADNVALGRVPRRGLQYDVARARADGPHPGPVGRPDAAGGDH
jgi:simple sugar transport system ATP-binding protein